MRAVIPFFAGFVAGMLFLIGLLWMRGSLQPVRAAIPATAPPQQPIAAPPPAPAQAVPPPPAQPQPALAAEVPDLTFPVQGADASKMLDTFEESRPGGGRHEAVDIMAPRGAPVLAVDGGVIVKLFLSRAGGITIYQFDPTRTWCYYYAHLDRYAPGLHEGVQVHRGDLIAYVDSTGDASPAAPHLHFAIFRLGPEKQWWKGTPVNPYPVLMRHARR